MVPMTMQLISSHSFASLYFRGELRDVEKQYNPMKISELSKYTRRPFDFNYQNEKDFFQKYVQRINSDVPWLDYINSLLTDFTDQVKLSKSLRDVDKTIFCHKLGMAANLHTIWYWPYCSQVTEDERVIVRHPSYITKLAELIRNTPKKVQVMFCFLLGWNPVCRNVDFLTIFLKKSSSEFFTQANYLISRAVVQSTSFLTKVSSFSFLIISLI